MKWVLVIGRYMRNGLNSRHSRIIYINFLWKWVHMLVYKKENKFTLTLSIEVGRYTWIEFTQGPVYSLLHEWLRVAKKYVSPPTMC
jgi:hypothetical protein